MDAKTVLNERFWQHIPYMLSCRMSYHRYQPPNTHFLLFPSLNFPSTCSLDKSSLTFKTQLRCHFFYDAILGPSILISVPLNYLSLWLLYVKHIVYWVIILTSLYSPTEYTFFETHLFISINSLQAQYLALKKSIICVCLLIQKYLFNILSVPGMVSLYSIQSHVNYVFI